ncbi:hypothetical protein NC651_001024 [Populus alba x Populus x berolinensis]|nr:hypothetical protein NC651_001024 [Populus alba x Populus x berolinensis]
MTDVVRMIENVRQMDTENHQSPQNRSESSTPPALFPVLAGLIIWLLLFAFACNNYEAQVPWL